MDSTIAAEGPRSELTEALQPLYCCGVIAGSCGEEDQGDSTAEEPAESHCSG